MQNLEEALREVCCLGDLEKVKILVGRGVNVNSQNKVNGWTGLHWAAKRNHKDLVSYLLSKKADASILTFQKESAIDLTQDKEIKQLLSAQGEEITLGGDCTDTDDSQELPIKVEFVPNYILNPDFPYSESAAEFARRLGIHHSPMRTSASNSEGFNKSHALSNCNDKQLTPEENEGDLVLKFRIAGSDEKDFIEIELDRQCISFTALVDICLKEFNVERSKLKKIRKMPNTIVRNDRDVKRLKQFQEMEIVIE